MIKRELVDRCQRGDISAFRTIYEQFEPALLRTALRMLGDRAEAEDAVQNTFIRLYRGIGRFQFRSSFDTYLYRILMNVCLDVIGRRQRLQRLQWHPEQPVISEQQEVRITLEEAIGHLPERMRACFILFAIEELPQTEIAAIMRISTGGVKSTIFQAKVRLRAFLSEHESKKP